MPSFAFLSTYPPTRARRPGDLHAGAGQRHGRPGWRARAHRASHGLRRHPRHRLRRQSGPTIVGELHRGDPASGRDAARLLSASDAVIVQHEYGIYGGTRRRRHSSSARRAPPRRAIVVLHTVLLALRRHQREVLEQVVRLAGAVVVMTRGPPVGCSRSNYSVDAGKVSVIPHGVADWSSVAATTTPERQTDADLGSDRAGQGDRVGHPGDGRTGPHRTPLALRGGGSRPTPGRGARRGAYRQGLQRLIAELGLDDRVILDDRYLDAPQLLSRWRAPASCCCRTTVASRSTSGVLSEAVAAGKDVVATTFPHSSELLANAVGQLVEHEVSTAIAGAVRAILHPADASITVARPWPT